VNINAAAKQTGIAAKSLRYYEEIGLVAPHRLGNGYRDYDGDDVQRLRFLRRSRDLGFTIADCRSLLELWSDRSRASADVKAIANKHLADVEHKLAELETMRSTLSLLVDACHGDNQPECPILRDLAGSLSNSAENLTS
jgi:MerR family transcriptional regulator, copper efflux regulator